MFPKLKYLHFMRPCHRRLSQKTVPSRKKLNIQTDPTYIRNIGILAHIDAGKTTTTERMLFYSGTINTMGEVHHGNTVTDFMDQERQRGITITSASVSFPWGDHLINLVDTPGHIDFTMEVEQTLNVLDGAVVVLDASAGVEAQTITVWRQADRYKIPRIIYINKMDRPDADFQCSIASVEKKLKEVPLPIQMPYGNGKNFQGVVDLLDMELLIWDRKSLGSNVTRRNLNEKDEQLWEDAMKNRVLLTETLADCDDGLAEFIVAEDQSTDTVSSSRLRESIRKATLKGNGVPIVCGSSYKNIGVQPLMDTVIQYLPSPVSQIRENIAKDFQKNLCAKAFKVRHDTHKGAITFFRIYSGKLKKGQKVYNIRYEGSEVLGKLLIATADDYEEVDEVGVGNIVATTGMKFTATGDIITTSASAYKSTNKKGTTGAFMTVIPDPVFFCSIECASQAYQAILDKSLAELSREDPSLRVHQDQETGQTVLGGMGELHLDVVKERIRSDYRIDVSLGPLQIAYKERLLGPAKDSHAVSLKIGSSQHSVNITMSVAPSEGHPKETLLLDRSPASASNISTIFPKHLVAIKNGVELALNRGPKLSCPVVNVVVTLHWLEVGRGTSETVISSAASQCVRKLLLIGETNLLEPIMQLEVICPPEMMATVNADLTRRRAALEGFNTRGNDKVLLAYVPLSELLGYASHLRSVTSGQASFTMQFHTLQEMSAFEEAKAIKSVTGLDPLQ